MCVIVWAWTAYIMKAQCGCVRRHERIHDTCHCASIPRSFFSFLCYFLTHSSLWFVFLPINLSLFFLSAQSSHIAQSVTAAFIWAEVLRPSSITSRFSIKYRHRHSWIYYPQQWCTMKNTSKGYLKWHAVSCLSFSAPRLILIMNSKGGRIFDLGLIWHYHPITERQNGSGQRGTWWMDQCGLKKQTYMKHDRKSPPFRSYHTPYFSMQLQGLEAFHFFFKAKALWTIGYDWTGLLSQWLELEILIGIFHDWIKQIVYVNRMKFIKNIRLTRTVCSQIRKK